MANIDGHYDQDAQAQESVSTGDHKAEIVESEIKPVSEKQDVGNNLTLTWKVVEGSDAGKLIWQKLNLFFTGNNSEKVVQISNSQFAAVRSATGVATPKESSELHNRPCIISVGPQKNSPEYQEVKRVKSVGAQQSASTGSADNGQASSPFARQTA